MSNMIVANTILQQLGGNRFIAMTGASNFVGSEKGLSFRMKSRGICRPTNKSNICRITLRGDDTYDMEFLNMNSRTLDMKDISKHEGLYADMLCSIFTDETGLDTRL